MRRALLVLVPLLLVGALPSGTAACAPTPDGRAIEIVDGYYLLTPLGAPVSAASVPSVPRIELWQETNGADGLQAFTYRCSDGTSVLPDRLVTRVAEPQNGMGI